MTGQRLTPDLIHDILGALDRHGYARADDEHVGLAVVLISDLAHIYEGVRGLRHAAARAATRRLPAADLHAVVAPAAGR